MNTQNNETTKRNNLNNYLLGIMVALLVLNLFISNNNKTTPTFSTVSNRNNHVKDIQLPPVFETYAKEADESINNTLNQYSLQINSICDRYYYDADRFASRLAAEACTYSNCLTLIKYMAMDKIKDTNEADSYLNSLLESSMNSKLSEIKYDIDNSFDRIQNDLLNNSQNYAHKMSAILPKASKLHFDSEIAYTEQDFQGLINRFGIVESVNVTALALDMGYIIGSGFFSTLRNTISRLAMTAFKAPLKKAVTSLGISLVDGPLPIGDIIGGIGIAWTAYDIKCERDEFERNVKYSISRQFTEQVNNLRCQAQNSGKDVCDQHKRMRVSLAQAFETEYKKTIQ